MCAHVHIFRYVCMCACIYVSMYAFFVFVIRMIHTYTNIITHSSFISLIIGHLPPLGHHQDPCPQTLIARVRGGRIVTRWRDTLKGAPYVTGGGGAVCVVDGMLVLMHHEGKVVKIHRLCVIPQWLWDES